MHVRNVSLIVSSPDNHMINGTKLLNIAGMTRGRRDGILKSEKMRHVVKIGPMHLKGVWYATFPILLLELPFVSNNDQDSVRAGSRFCEQGEDYRVALPPFRPQH